MFKRFFAVLCVFGVFFSFSVKPVFADVISDEIVLDSSMYVYSVNYLGITRLRFSSSIPLDYPDGMLLFNIFSEFSGDDFGCYVQDSVICSVGYGTDQILGSPSKGDSFYLDLDFDPTTGDYYAGYNGVYTYIGNIGSKPSNFDLVITVPYDDMACVYCKEFPDDEMCQGGMPCVADYGASIKGLEYFDIDVLGSLDYPFVPLDDPVDPVFQELSSFAGGVGDSVKSALPVAVPVVGGVGIGFLAVKFIRALLHL